MAPSYATADGRQRPGYDLRVPIRGIDHLVIAVRDPDAAADGLGRDLGLAFTGGGRHAAGTWNRLAFLGDAYLELIGVADRGRVLASPGFAVGRAALEILEGGSEGLATWAVAVDDCAAEVARLRLLGSPVGNPLPGSRTRPDGEAVRWVAAFPPRLGPREPPFLIEHEMAGPEWGPAALAARRAFSHPGPGAVRLAGLTLPVAAPEDLAARVAATLGIAFGRVPGGLVASIGRDTLRLRAAGEGLPAVGLASADRDLAPMALERHGVRWQIVAGAHRRSAGV